MLVNVRARRCWQAELLTVPQQERAERRPEPRVAGELAESVGAPPGDAYYDDVCSDERCAGGNSHCEACHNVSDLCRYMYVNSLVHVRLHVCEEAGC